MKPFDSLEQMKESWKMLSADSLKNELSSHEIYQIIRQKSKNELDKIRRKLLIETIISYFLDLGMMYYINTLISGYVWIFNSYIMVLVIIFSIPTFRILKTGRFRNQDTKEFLEKFVKRFERSIKLTFILVVTVLPASVVIAGITGFIAGYTGKTNPFPGMEPIFKDYFNTPLGLLLFGIIFIILITLFALFIIRFYYIFMYSKHIKSMKDFLAEISKIENAE